MPARGPRHRVNRQVYSGMLRSHEALTHYMQGGMSYREVAAAMNVSAQRAYVLVERALERINEDTANMARLLLARQIEAHQMVMRTSWDIVSAPCAFCKGACTLTDENTTRLKAIDSENKMVFEGAPCPYCRASGYLYAAAVRLAAMDRHERACGHVAKLLGLYAPERRSLHVQVSWREELSELSDEDIDRMLQEYAREAAAAVEGTAYVRDVRQLPAGEGVPGATHH